MMGSNLLCISDILTRSSAKTGGPITQAEVDSAAAMLEAARNVTRDIERRISEGVDVRATPESLRRLLLALSPESLSLTEQALGSIIGPPGRKPVQAAEDLAV